MKNKIDVTTLLSVGATVLTIASTIVSSKADNKLMEKMIREEVIKEFGNIYDTNK